MVLLDDAGKRRDCILNPRVHGGRVEGCKVIVNAVSAKAKTNLHVSMALFDGGDIGGGEVCGVPEDVEFAISSGGGIGGGVVYGEGKDEVELDIGVDRNVGEFDAVEQGSDVFCEEVGVLSSGHWKEESKERFEEEEIGLGWLRFPGRSQSGRECLTRGLMPGTSR